MKRLLPRSLIGQIALVMALALLVAQGINFYLVSSERSRLTQAQIEAPVMARFVAGVQRVANSEDGEIISRRGRTAIEPASRIAPEAADPEMSERLREAAQANSLEVREARAAISEELPPVPRARAGEHPRILENNEERARRFRSLLLSVQLPDGRWVNAQLQVPRPTIWPLIRHALATILIYAALLGAMLLVAVRLTRPLRDLTRAATTFDGSGRTVPVEPRGPADIRRAIDAFNAMSARVGSLLEEKDRMLGAIGHDLRTPLASLRIRAENMEPADERERMVETISEMAAMLEDTLDLARSGRSSEPARPLDISALVDALVEEYHDMGHPVTFGESARVVACVRPNLVRRAVRNLIDNAIKYAGDAELSVRATDGRVVIEVADRGPGIPDHQLIAVREPFVRLEASRSRATGGSGLGLALARAAALLHGGELELENRSGGGLIVRLSVLRS